MPALATAPHVFALLPTGAQRGTEVQAVFEGDRLQDAQEVFCYEPGIEVLKLDLVTNRVVKARLKLAADCPLGEHHFRLRTRTGLSEVSTFLVGPFENQEAHRLGHGRRIQSQWPSPGHG